jgi:hypothetical protein
MGSALAVDLRTLALFRVALGLLLLADLALRSGDLVAHYSDWGVLPRALLEPRLGEWRWSLHLLHGSAAWQSALFVVAALAAVSLTLGYRTRLATLVSWVLLQSLQTRNPLVLQGGDNLLLLLLFWSLFLPLGARASLDAALDRSPRRDSQHLSVASAAILIQAMSVYFFSALLKSSPDWLPDGTAVYYAFHNDQFAAPVAEWLRQFPGAMRAATIAVWWLELLGPLLIFSPVLRVPLRLLFLGLFLALEVSFIVCLRIGLFPFISITSLLLFLPGEFWDRIARRGAGRRRGLVMFYDRDCGFCEKTCRILRELLILPEASIRPAQSDPAMGPLLERENSWVVVDGTGSRHLRWAAMAAVFRHSPWLAWLAPLLGAGPVVAAGDRVYHWVGEHRRSLSRITAVLLPWRTRRVGHSSAVNALALLCLVYVLTWNLGTLPAAGFDFPARLQPIGDVLRLDQTWNMFAPRPRRDDGWFVAPGRLLDGRSVDAYRGTLGDADFSRPEVVGRQFDSYRWRKYMMRIWLKRYRYYRRGYARFVCRDWNARHGGGARLDTFKLWYVQERTQPDYRPPVVSRHLLWYHGCFGRPEAP